MKKRIFKITLLAIMAFSLCSFFSCGTDSNVASEVIDKIPDVIDPVEEDTIADETTPDPVDEPLVMTLVTSEEIKSIPLPTLGKRWVVNWEYTDEFNGDKLDDSKWQKFNPNWKGRAPGYFAEENVNVKDGYLKINTGVPDEPIVVTNWDKSTTTYTKTCGFCSSKKATASYGYYECNFKSNKLTTGQGFWFSSRGNFPSPLGGTFGEELDVCECIGRTGDFDGKDMYDGMHSNIHYWYKDLKNTSYDMRALTPNGKSWEAGFNQYLPEGNKPCDNFHTYGCWWASSSAAAFYLDNNDGGLVPFNWKLAKDQPNVDASQCVIDQPMALNMDVETYPFPWVTLPTDEEMVDPTINMALFDWVRSYTLSDSNVSNVDSKDMYMFDKHVHCLSKPEKSSKDILYVHLAYTSNEDCKLKFEVYNDNKEVVSSKDFNAYAGYSNNEYSINAGVESGNRYYIFCYLLPKDSKNIADAYETDSYMTTIK